MTLAAPIKPLPATPASAANLERKGGASLPRMPSLDGLRGIAVISIVIGHSFATALSDRAELVDKSVNIGLRLVVPYSIDLFFVISGYLITAILYETRSADRPLLTFYGRRVLRIVPLYYLYLLLAPIIFLIRPPEALGNASPLWEWLFLTNVAMLQGVDAVGYLKAHFWTLSIEEQFYFLWPLAMLLAPARRLLLICVSLIGFSFIARTALTLSGEGDAAWLLAPTRMDGLILGGAVAILQRRNIDFLLRWSRPVLTVCGGVLIPGLLLAVGYSVWDETGTILQTFDLRHTGRLVEIIFVPIVGGMFFAAATSLLVMNNSGREKVLTSPRLLSVAEASYGMYVFHIPILVLLDGFGISHLVPGYDLLNQLLLSAIALVLSYGVGHVTWIYFEKRFIRMAPRYRYSSAPG